MIKWFVYIVFLLVFAPYLLLAKTKSSNRGNRIDLPEGIAFYEPSLTIIADTVKTVKNAAKTQDLKVKEVAKAKRQPKPQKVDGNGGPGDAQKVKPKRQRRPDGMERPPEIPRRNDN